MADGETNADVGGDRGGGGGASGGGAAASPPPPLGPLRRPGGRARGLNKRAILFAVGGGVGVVLALAAVGLGGDPMKRPAETKPMMSDPARPEMAQGALKGLPASYAQAVLRSPPPVLPAPTASTPEPPQLGPPLPGDVAAFAPSVRARDGGASTGEAGRPHAPEDGDRAGLFYTLRQEAKATSAAAPAHNARNPMAAVSFDGASSRLREDEPKTCDALFPGAVIGASLVTAVNTQSPGPIVAQVTQTVYDSATGACAVIPQGARLIGAYRSNVRYGERRVAILWSRLIMPDGEEITLEEPAGDPSGAAGIGGRTVNHWGEVFGAALLGTLIDVGAAAIEQHPQVGVTYGNVGVVSQDPVDAALVQGASRAANAVTNRVIDRGIAIAPTISVDAGTRIAVIVTRRLSFRARA